MFVGWLRQCATPTPPPPPFLQRICISLNSFPQCLLVLWQWLVVVVIIIKHPTCTCVSYIQKMSAHTLIFSHSTSELFFFTCFSFGSFFFFAVLCIQKWKTNRHDEWKTFAGAHLNLHLRTIPMGAQNRKTERIYMQESDVYRNKSLVGRLLLMKSFNINFR